MSAAPLVVLGAGGFIGHAVVREALSSGARVKAICTGDPWRLQEMEREVEIHIHTPWWTQAFAHELRELLRPAAALILLAYCPPPHGSTDAQRAEHEDSVNTAGVRIACTAAASEGRRVVFSSSADIYGSWHEDPVDESSVPRPHTPYAAAKLEAEAIVAEASVPSSSLRIATVYGPGETGHRAIPTFITGLLRDEALTLHGDGSDVRDYVAVTDVAKALIAVALMSRPPRLVNIGSGVGRTTRDVALSVGKAVGKEPTFRYSATLRTPSRLVLDISLARRSFGFDPETDIGTVLHEELPWIRRHVASGAPNAGEKGRRT
jgi:UDP-glucose 4-epimerase